MPLNATAIQSALSHETDKVWVLLMKIDHADLASPIYLALSDEPVTSNGDLYQPAAFRVDWPKQEEDSPPRARVAVENANLAMVQAVRSIDTPPSFTMQIVLRDDPDTVQAEAASLTLKDPSWDENWVTGELTYERIFQEPFGRLFTPAGFPALFKALNEAN